MAGEVKALEHVLGQNVSDPSELGLAADRLVVYASDAAYEAAKGAGSQGDIYFNSTSKKARLHNGTVWGNVGGGGGGGSLEWYEPQGKAAIYDEEYNQKVFLFTKQDATTQYLTAIVKVPTDYTAGSQISMKIGLYSPSSSNTIKLVSTAYLIRKNNDAFNSTTNSRASTNAALTNTVANQYRETSLDLTDSSGQVNGVAVSGGDVLKVELSRASDTDTADARFIPTATELSFA